MHIKQAHLFDPSLIKVFDLVIAAVKPIPYIEL